MGVSLPAILLFKGGKLVARGALRAFPLPHSLECNVGVTDLCSDVPCCQSVVGNDHSEGHG